MTSLGMQNQSHHFGMNFSPGDAFGLKFYAKITRLFRLFIG